MDKQTGPAGFPLLAKILEEMKSPDDVPDNFMAVIADHLEEAICAPSRTSLVKLTQELSAFFDQILKVSPDGLIAAIMSDAPDDQMVRAAYLLGQVAFAQLLAGQTYIHRPDDEFYEVMKDPAYTPYLRAMAEQDRSKRELVAITGDPLDEVTRKLYKMNGLGISDFHSDGKEFKHFLTPAARALFDASK